MCSFFFDEGGETSAKRKKSQVPLETAKKLGCQVCPLKTLGAYHPDMPPWGSEKPIIYFLGEAPDEMEDKENRPFIGKSGQLLKDHIPKSFENSYRLNNTVRCFISPKVKVFTLNGYKMIKDVQIGELVLTHTGQFKRVLSRLHDLPSTSRSYKEDLIEVSVELSDYGLRTQSPGTIKQTVTLYHRYLKADGSWIEAKDLKDGDTVIVLASICEQCGKPYFGNYQHERVHDFCSPNCHNQYVSSINGAAISRYMTTAIKSGVRSQVNLHKAAAIARKNLLESGQHTFQNMSQLSRFKQCKTKTWHSIGENEDVFKQTLTDAGYIVKPQKSFAIEEDLKVVVYDLYIESLNVVIEIDGKSHNNHKVWRQDEYKNQVATNLGLTLLRVNAYSDPAKLVSQLQRLEQNHNGEYLFITAKIQVKRYPPKRTMYLYCLEVEEDSSFIANGIISHNSRPPGNRTPTELELACCRKSIEDDIAKTQPKVIVAVGSTALNWLFDGEKGQDIAKWRGRFFPVTIAGFSTWSYCIYHPSYILRGQRTNASGQTYKSDLDYLFEADMNRLFSQVRNLPPYTPITDPLEGVTITEGIKSDRELEKVLHWLDKLCQEPIIAIDYETTGLRPYVANAKILTVAVGTDKKTYAFPLRYPGAWSSRQLQKLEEAFKEFLLSSGYKIGQNTKFELEWSAFFFGEEILYDTKWEDTQAQAYVLDERKGTHNLDTLIRTYFGFWLKDLSPMDKAHMETQPLNKILPYNAMDTKWTFALFKKQHQLLEQDPKLLKVYNDLIPMMIMLAQVQLRGLVFDPQACAGLRKEYETSLKAVEQQIQARPEAQEYKIAFNQPFNPASPNHVISVFRDILGAEKRLMSESGKLSTDESVLSKLTEFPLAKLILEYRGFAKKISTYIDAMPGFVMPDGRIHTTYNPYETTTGRLSAQEPNLQNIPSKTGKEPRSVFCAPEGHVLVCCDYGQIEARLIGAASQDKNFCDALWENYDVHMEWAKKIAETYPKVVGGVSKLDDPKAIKTFRSKVKNLWVFPAFYGASYKSISAGIGVPVDLTEELFDEFWNQFSGVRKWQRWLLKRYNEMGYVESLFGRRRHAPLTANAVLNAPIQSSASDICVLSMVELNKLGLNVVLNVHDEVGFYIPEDQLEEQVNIIVREMTRPKLSWLNIPISVEVKIGKNWFDMEECLTVDSTQFHTVSRKLLDFTKIYDM